MNIELELFHTEKIFIGGISSIDLDLICVPKNYRDGVKIE